MEDCNHKRKRVIDESPDSESDSPELKTHRVDSSESKESDPDDNSSESQLTRVDSVESDPDSVPNSDVQLQDDIFNILDDADNVPDSERDSVQGLDSVIKSFEEEILVPGSDPGQVDPNNVPESGEVQTNLGYLLEASDDELGLPPTVTSGEETEPGRVDPVGVDLTGFVGFEDDIPSYDPFGFGLTPECGGDNGGAGGFVTTDGLFDYSESAGDVLWRSESLQAM